MLASNQVPPCTSVGRLAENIFRYQKPCLILLAAVAGPAGRLKIRYTFKLYDNLKGAGRMMVKVSDQQNMSSPVLIRHCVTLLSEPAHAKAETWGGTFPHRLLPSLHPENLAEPAKPHRLASNPSLQTGAQACVWAKYISNRPTSCGRTGGPLAVPLGTATSLTPTPAKAWEETKEPKSRRWQQVRNKKPSTIPFMLNHCCKKILENFWDQATWALFSSSSATTWCITKCNTTNTNTRIVAKCNKERFQRQRLNLTHLNTTPGPGAEGAWDSCSSCALRLFFRQGLAQQKTILENDPCCYLIPLRHPIPYLKSRNVRKARERSWGNNDYMSPTDRKTQQEA